MVPVSGTPPGEQDRSKNLFDTRGLLIFLLSGAIATLAATGTGLAVWAKTAALGSELGVVAAMGAGGAVWFLVFFGAVKTLDSLVR